MCWLQGLVQWLLRGPGQPLSRQRLIKYLPEICQWEVPCTARMSGFSCFCKLLCMLRDTLDVCACF